MAKPGGELVIGQSALGGLKIEVTVPLKTVAVEEEETHEPQDAHTAG